MSRKIIFILLLLTICIAFAQPPPPHTMWGYLYNLGGAIPKAECLQFKAFVIGQPVEFDTIFYPDDPRATFNELNGAWTAQIGELEPLTDDLFVIVFENTCSSYIGSDTAVVDMTIDPQFIENITMPVFEGKSSKLKPRNFNLSISPSPFNSSCKISFDGRGSVNIDIYNVIGQPVKEIYDGVSQGRMEFIWHPEGFPAGIYFVRAKSETCSATQKIIFLP